MAKSIGWRTIRKTKKRNKIKSMEPLKVKTSRRKRKKKND